MAQKDKNIKDKDLNEKEQAIKNEDLKKEKSEDVKDTQKSDKKVEPKKKEAKKKSKEEKKQEENFEDKYNNINDKYLRLTAEFDNYRKRTLKERMELMKNAGEDILINFLPVMDNIDRAIKSTDEAKDIKALKEGVTLIHKNLFDFLKERGIKEMESIGQIFDTDLHEAITKIPAPEEDLKGKVVDVIEKGYILKDKVIRYAKVVVGE